MKLFRTVVFCIATSTAVIAQPSNGKLEIPAGVKYKLASDEVNAAAKALLEKALAGDKSALKQFLSNAVTCGPTLWQTLKPGAAPELLYTKAADQGNLAATNDLGWCYQQGEGVEKDLTKAIALYTKAAEAGHLRGQGNLAMLYRASGGWDKAYMWLRVAEIGGGGAQARSAIEDVKKHMTQAQVDAAEAKVAEWQKAHATKP